MKNAWLMIVFTCALGACASREGVPTQSPGSTLLRSESAGVTRYVERIVGAGRSGARMPLLAEHGLGPGLVDAYAIQALVVQQHDRPFAGLKAGLTSPGSQARFGAKGPVAGVLLRPPLTARQIDPRNWAQLMIEVELGFRLARNVTQPLQSESDLADLIDCVAPVIELPDLGFADMQHLQVVDIVAANVSAREFIVGDTGCAVPFVQLGDVGVSLERDGQLVTSGKASDAMGGQATALRWLINRSLASGYPVREGQWLITGALGAMVPGVPGMYRARFGDHWELRFAVATPVDPAS